MKLRITDLTLLAAVENATAPFDVLTPEGFLPGRIFPASGIGPAVDVPNVVDQTPPETKSNPG